MTLLDFPGRVACTVFLGGCDFRCPFCHNALLVTDIDNDNTFDEEEIIEYLYGLISNVRRAYNSVEDPMWLLSLSGEVEQIYSVLRALDRRNKENDVQ